MANEYRETHSEIQSAGNGLAVASIDTVALYDPRDGRIVHMHQVIAFEGVRRQNPDELHLRAAEAAKRFGCKVDCLKGLHVPNFSPAVGKIYRVDPKKPALVEERAAARSTR